MRGQKLEKLLSNHEAQNKSGAHSRIPVNINKIERFKVCRRRRRPTSSVRTY